MNIKIEVLMTAKIMYNYVLQHTYTSIGGILGVVFGIVSGVWGVEKFLSDGLSEVSAALVVLCFMFIVVNPIMLWSKARKQVKHTPAFQKPICYELNDTGIVVSQDGQENTMPWEQVMKVTATNMSVIIYFSRMRAFILPKAAFGENYTKALELIFTHVPSQKVKIRTAS